MNHPLVMYDLITLRHAEDMRRADHDRLVREAGAARRSRSIDAVPFRERLARLLGATLPRARGGEASGA